MTNFVRFHVEDYSLQHLSSAFSLYSDQEDALHFALRIAELLVSEKGLWGATFATGHWTMGKNQLRLWHDKPGGSIRADHVDSRGQGLLISMCGHREDLEPYWRAFQKLVGGEVTTHESGTLVSRSPTSKDV